MEFFSSWQPYGELWNEAQQYAEQLEVLLS